MDKELKGLSGQNNPKQQYVIRDIMNDMHRMGIDAVPEEKIELDEKDEKGHQKYVIPDIVIRIPNRTVYVEICTSATVSKNITKLNTLIKQKDAEGFVYDYEKEIWYSVNKNDKSERVVGSHSTILDYDLSRSLRLAQAREKAKEIYDYAKKQS